VAGDPGVSPRHDRPLDTTTASDMRQLLRPGDRRPSHAQTAAGHSAIPLTTATTSFVLTPCAPRNWLGDDEGPSALTGGQALCHERNDAAQPAGVIPLRGTRSCRRSEPDESFRSREPPIARLCFGDDPPVRV